MMDGRDLQNGVGIGTTQTTREDDQSGTPFDEADRARGPPG